MKKNQVRELDFTEIHSKNILFDSGNESRSCAVQRIEQVKIL